MRHQNYALIPIQITNAQPKARPYKLTDGGGLYLVVSPGGTKAWRYQYRYAGARCDVGIGTFPEIGIADARDQHRRYRAMLERGVDPAVARRQQVQERSELSVLSRRRADNFESFSKRWVQERMTTRSATYRAQILSRLERFVWPLIGTKPLGRVRPVDVLRVIEPLILTPNTAEGVRVLIQQIYNYAIQTLIVEVNPALPLRGVVQVPPAKHYRHLREAELGAFWCAVEKQGARFVTIAATKLLAYSMCRKSEVLRAQWSEFDLERAVWDIPAVRMKMKRPHRVYLSRQAVELLRLLRAVTGLSEGYVFPSLCRRSVPTADVTLNHFFKRIDFGVDDFAPHGLRSTGATLLREHGFGREVVELLLAHKERNPTTAAYHHHELADERRRALQYLADQIHHLAEVHRQPPPASAVAPASAQTAQANC
ncbi:MAG: integrase arm-type DNA-binding domain-containing protein [Rubrivivax sp.]